MNTLATIVGDLGRAAIWFLLIAALVLFAGTEGIAYIYTRF